MNWEIIGFWWSLIPYDGVKRFSEIAIESIALWIRIYDIPLIMMKKKDFVRVLGEKIGMVLEVGEARMDYKRVKVDFPLAKAIMPAVQIKVKDRGFMKFDVRYENIPHFCFLCGRIGHAQRECPEEMDGDGGVRFGTALRCSPQKRDVGRHFTIPAIAHRAKRGLNFSGEQKERVMAGNRSSNRPSSGSNFKEGGRAGERDGGNSGQEADAGGLAERVASMSVDTNNHDTDEALSKMGLGKVSGLDSFMDSSTGSLHTRDDSKRNLSMHERLVEASSAGGRGMEQVGGNHGGGTVVMDIDRQKRNKMAAAGEMGRSSQGGGNYQEKLADDPEHEVHGTVAGASLEKRHKTSSKGQVNLTGAQAGARQEQ